MSLVLLFLICLIVYYFRGFLKALGTLFIMCCIVILLGKWFLVGCFLVAAVFVLVTNGIYKNN